MVYNGCMEFMTRNEVAWYLRVNRRTVERWLKGGLIRGYKLGSGRTALWRIPKGELKKFLDEHSSTKHPWRKSRKE